MKLDVKHITCSVIGKCLDALEWAIKRGNSEIAEKSYSEFMSSLRNIAKIVDSAIDDSSRKAEGYANEIFSALDFAVCQCLSGSVSGAEMLEKAKAAALEWAKYSPNIFSGKAREYSLKTESDLSDQIISAAAANKADRKFKSLLDLFNKFKWEFESQKLKKEDLLNIINELEAEYEKSTGAIQEMTEAYKNGMIGAAEAQKRITELQGRHVRTYKALDYRRSAMKYFIQMESNIQPAILSIQEFIDTVQLLIEANEDITPFIESDNYELIISFLENKISVYDFMSKFKSNFSRFNGHRPTGRGFAYSGKELSETERQEREERNKKEAMDFIVSIIPDASARPADAPAFCDSEANKKPDSEE